MMGLAFILYNTENPVPYNYPIKFGKYLLTRRIAVGGMAEVFKAKLIGLKGFEKTLALKKILPEFGEDEDFVQMFVDEARISSNLHHSNIVQVFDFGQVEASYYITMEYVDGPNLKSLFQRYLTRHDRFPQNFVFYIAIQIAKALEYAHNVHLEGQEKLQLVHRDVSPQNILISRSGEVKITDFGIAKAAIKISKTQPGKIQGKLSYMSPEQASGQHLDRRSDIFSLGVIIYELLTGEKLYAAENTSARFKEVRQAEIRRVGFIIPDLPSQAESLIMRMLAKNPEERPQTTADVIKELSDVLSDISTESLAIELGQIVNELFPKEESDSDVARKIQDLAMAREDSIPQRTEISLKKNASLLNQKAKEKTKNFAHDERTALVWYKRFLENKWLYAILGGILLTIPIVMLWQQKNSKTQPPIVNESSSGSEEPSNDANISGQDKAEIVTTPRSGQVDADLWQVTLQREAAMRDKLNELEDELKKAQENTLQAEKDLSEVKKELEKVVVAQKAHCPKDMIYIPSGRFASGSSKSDPDRNDLAEADVQIIPNQAFCVDPYEYPNQKGIKPSVKATWNEAVSLCARLGKRLCLSEEWERACKGPDGKNLRYPYGEKWDPQMCNTEGDESLGGHALRPLAKAGEFGRCVTQENIYDMSGNVEEWTKSPGRFNPKGRIVKGGSSQRPGYQGRCAALREVLPEAAESGLGFRCCKDAN